MTSRILASTSRVALLSAAFDNPPVPSAPMVTSPQAIAQVREAAQRAGGTIGAENDPMLVRAHDSAAMVDYWNKTDDIITGVDAMKARGSAYLPRFDDEDLLDYQNRANCVKMTNVYLDVVESLAAKPFEQEVQPILDEGEALPEPIAKFWENVDGAGSNMTVFAAHTFFNGINSAIDWIFVDHPERDPNIRTVADAKRAGIRPFWTHILGRNVLEASTSMINAREELTYIRIFEHGRPDCVRIIERDDMGVVRWSLYKKTDNLHDAPPPMSGKTRFLKDDEGVISIGVIPLVPFITGRRDGRTFRISPPMRAAADLQIELYQEESALKWNKKLGAYAMLTGNGISPPTNADGSAKKLTTGPNKALYAPPSAKTGQIGSWEWIQPSADIMRFLADDNKSTIEQLRELGKQPLTAQSGNLTVITTAVAAGKSRSALQAWALTLKNALENALVLTGKFMGLDTATYDPQVFVFTDWDDTGQDNSADLSELGAARGRKDISRETYWSELKRRGTLSAEFDPKDEEKRLLAEIPLDDGEDTGDDENGIT